MKKIDHFYKNLDIEKLIGVLDNWTKPNLLHFLVDEVTKCVNGYNEINDEEVFFRTYLEDLLRSGELFINLKEYFSINSYLTLELATSENHSNDIWNQVYILYSKVDKKYRLMHINCQNRPPKYFISILDRYSASPHTYIHTYCTLYYKYESMYCMRRPICLLVMIDYCLFLLLGGLVE